jgi:hypothetical protein
LPRVRVCPLATHHRARGGGDQATPAPDIGKRQT